MRFFPVWLIVALFGVAAFLTGCNAKKEDPVPPRVAEILAKDQPKQAVVEEPTAEDKQKEAEEAAAEEAQREKTSMELIGEPSDCYLYYKKHNGHDIYLTECTKYNSDGPDSLVTSLAVK